MRIAYLVDYCPSVSDDAVGCEIAGAQAAGLEVLRFPIWTPGRSQAGNGLPSRQASATAARSGECALALFSAGLRRPRSFVRALIVTIGSMRRDRRHRMRHMSYLAQACRVAARARDLAHVHAQSGVGPSCVARLVHRLVGTPYSFTADDPGLFDEPVALELEAQIADACFVIGGDSFSRSQLMRWSAAENWSRIHVLGAAVDPLLLTDVPYMRRELPLLCCITPRRAEKALGLLIDATAELARRGVDFRLTLLGDGGMNDAISTMIAARSLEHSVSVIANVDAAEVRDSLLSARAMVLPSFTETVPSEILEALAMRTPVIVSQIAGTPELADDSCAWLVPVGSADRLAEAMEAALAASPAALEIMGAAGRARVLEHHDSRRNGVALAARIRAGC